MEQIQGQLLRCLVKAVLISIQFLAQMKKAKDRGVKFPEVMNMLHGCKRRKLER